MACDPVNDNGDPLRRLLADLEGRHAARGHRDRVHSTDEDRYDITRSGFTEIRKPNPEPPKRMAFVDGGNDAIYEAPNYLIALNRVYYAVFRGGKRLPTKNVRQKTTFLSCMMPGASTSDHNAAGSSRKELQFDTVLYPYDGGQDISDYLPDEHDLQSPGAAGDGYGAPKDAVPPASLARRLAEIRLATKVVSDELGRGDVLVMDGSLQMSFGVSQGYAQRLYERAMQKGVIVCGLAKTSRLLTESGESLLARIREVSSDVPFGRWYVPVSRKTYDDSSVSTLVVKLHPRSRFVFRLDILDERCPAMSGAQRDEVLASLAFNSEDAAILGYPYGAVDADKHAKVRKSEAAMYRRALDSRLHEDPRLGEIARHADSIIFHDVLNRVTG